MKIHRNFVYRIFPTREQSLRLMNWENTTRFVWNLANEQRVMGLSRPSGERKFTSAYAQSRELTEMRREHHWLADVPRYAITTTLERLHLAWGRFFRKNSSRPRFKKKIASAASIGLDHRRVHLPPGSVIKLPKLGLVAIARHRELVGRTKQFRLVRDVDQWFVIFTQEIEHAAPPRLPGVVGIDRGVIALTVDSYGRPVVNPRFTDRSARKLKRLSQNLSRTKKGSSNRAKARTRVAKVHRKIRRQRAWLQHQISHDYANSHGTVVIEKLETARMTRSARGTVEAPGRNVRQKVGLNRSILDAGWSGLRDKLKYKLEERGGELVEVPAAYSSQTCSACGVVDAASRRTQAEFCCVACGHEQNADVNAARVILSRWNPPVQPVEAS